MKTLTLMLLSMTFALTAATGQAQNAQTTQIEDTNLFINFESNPVFPGGEEARVRYLAQNIRYPEEARKDGIQGTVYLSFVIDRDGHIRDVKLLRGIGGGCDEEAIRVAQNMPNWTPGTYKGENVRVQYSMPIKFTLALAEEDTPKELYKIETPPVFPGGEEARVRYLAQNIRYPEEARKDGIQGTVYLSFVIDRDGHIRDVKLLRGIGGGCDEEAIRVVQNMPNWTPGKINGKSVRVQYSMPIKFTLTSTEEYTPKELFQVKVDPVFPGGEEACEQYFARNIRYPREALRNEIQGTVYVSFVIDSKGRATDIKIVSGISKECNEEAIRLVRNMPRWKPGKVNGKPARVQYVMPIKFTLTE